MRFLSKLLIHSGLILGIAGDAIAQAPGAAPGPRVPGGAAPRVAGSVTAILNARRQLDLTPRQVAQLDSIERVLHNERERAIAAQRPAMDSLRSRVRAQGMPHDSVSRQQMRQQMEARRAQMRPQMERLRQQDSAATVAAERILNETQRTKWRELQAERRGFARGMREQHEMRGMQRRREGNVPGMQEHRQHEMRGQRPSQMRRPGPDGGR